MRTRPHHCPLDDSHQSSMNLTHLANTFKLKCGSACKTRISSKTSHLYHSIASVIAEDHNVDRRGVIGHTDSSFSGLVFPVSVKWSGLGEAVQALFQTSMEGVYSRVVIADGGGESTGTNPEAHHMDPFAEPRLYPKPQPCTATHVKESKFHQEILRNMLIWSPWVWKESNRSSSENQPGEANASQQHPTESKKCCWWKWMKVNI